MNEKAGQGRGQAYGTDEGICRLQGGVCLSPRAMGSNSRLYVRERHGDNSIYLQEHFLCAMGP